MDTDKWDIEAQPDVPGAPNKDQVATMVKKLLADRFQLKFHKDSKEMSAYVVDLGQGRTEDDQERFQGQACPACSSPVFLRSG